MVRARKRLQRHLGEEGGGEVSVARARGSYLRHARQALRRLPAVDPDVFIGAPSRPPIV
jgi:hypothetical protein